MRASDIFILIEDLKVFQMNELVDRLLKDWDFLGKSFVKTRVQSVVYGWVKYGVIVKVNDDPAVFALKDYADSWKEYYSGVKTCPVCGKKFLSRRGEQGKYCSRKCYEKAKTQRRKEDTRRRVRKYLRSAHETAVNKGKPWTKKDIEILRKLKSEGKTHREIAQVLGRTVYSVRWKLQKLQGGCRAN